MEAWPCERGPESKGPAAMPMTLLSAVLSSFFLVRLIKGPWMRYPHYLGLAMIGSILSTVILASVSPGMEDEFIAGNLAAFAGAFVAIQAFDKLTGINAP
jgi:hypothetical protein